jgi:hypothetical protein
MAAAGGLAGPSARGGPAAGDAASATGRVALVAVAYLILNISMNVLNKYLISFVGESGSGRPAAGVNAAVPGRACPRGHGSS